MRLIDADRIDRNQVTVYDYKDQKWVHIFEIPTEDAVSAETYQQTIWERDVALAQLNEIGKGFGEEMDDVATVIRCKDCKYAEYDEDLPNQYYCPNFESMVQSYFYCWWGKRRKDAETE